MKSRHRRRIQTWLILGASAFLTLSITPTSAATGRTLNVRFDAQDSALSCEVATLKMALAYKGVRVSESTLMSWVGYDTTARRGATWGNPNKGFVGKLNGQQNTTGYGVHWYPIRRAARKYRPADVYSWMTVQDLTREIDRGNPIVVWGTFRGTARYDPWRTPDGILIKAWYGEHTRLVIGYHGTAQRPTYIILMDPIKGRLVWTTQEFKNNWIHFINSGVVVR